MSGDRVRRRPKRIAVMQPYFFPYAGYFRLFAHADEFVLYDCVQFPRRGRVHRCEVPVRGDACSAVTGDAATRWLGLPLAGQARETRIHDLRFANDARATLDASLRALPWIAAARGPAADAVRNHLHAPLADVVDTLEAGLRLVRDLLGLATPIVRSSALGIPGDLRGQERILAIVAARGATAYVNSPGGRALYDAAAFEAAGISLEFLPDYAGRYRYMLPALLHCSPGDIALDVRSGAPTA